MKAIVKVLVFSVVLAALAMSCAGEVEIQKSPNAVFPLEVTDTAPAFIFPVSLHISGDSDAIGMACTAAVINEFGASVIPGQPLYDLVGNLSWTLGEGMRRQVNKGNFSLTGGADDVAEALDIVLEAIFTGLEELGAVEPGYRFKYIIALHTDTIGGGMPGTDSFVMFGGIYDVATKEILAYVESEQSVPAVNETKIATIPPKFVDVVNMLLTGETEAAKEE